MKTVFFIALIGGIIGSCLYNIMQKFLVRRSINFTLRFMKKVFDDISVIIAICFDVTRGLNYYTTHEYPERDKLIMGSVVRIKSTDRDYQERNKVEIESEGLSTYPIILPSEGLIGDLAIITRVNYNHVQKQWILMKIQWYKNV